MAPNAGLFLGKGTWQQNEEGELVAVFNAAQANHDPSSKPRTVSYTKETLEGLLDYLEQEARRTLDNLFKNIDYQYAIQTLKEYPAFDNVKKFGKPKRTELVTQSA